MQSICARVVLAGGLLGLTERMMPGLAAEDAPPGQTSTMPAASADDAGSEPPESTEIPPDLSDLSLEELTSLNIEDVVGAAKYTQKVTEAPSSVTIITADDIRKFGYRQFNEILQSVRGFP